jgi:hypothetical protein
MLTWEVNRKRDAVDITDRVDYTYGRSCDDFYFDIIEIKGKVNGMWALTPLKSFHYVYVDDLERAKQIAASMYHEAMLGWNKINVKLDNKAKVARTY